MSSSLVFQPLPSKSSWHLQCQRSWRSLSPFLILRQKTSVSARRFGNNISSSLSLKQNGRHHDDLQLHPELIPKHIALIMDGNRRWAKAKGLPVYEGHKLIIPKLKEICDVSSKLGIQIITAFAFSTENWKRSKEEVDFLMQLFEEFFEEFMRFNVRVSVIGCKSNLPMTLQKCITLTEEKTKENKGLHLVIALNYGGHYDILQATKSIASKVMNGKLQVENINKDMFEQELESKSKCINFHEPDLLIRTGGEQRISNFFLWQLAYSEIYFTKTLFPDFGENDLKEAILNFQQRHRRFGGHTY